MPKSKPSGLSYDMRQENPVNSVLRIVERRIKPCCCKIGHSYCKNSVILFSYCLISSAICPKQIYLTIIYIIYKRTKNEQI